MRIQSAPVAFSLRTLAPVALLLLAACSSGGGDSGGTTPPAVTYAIGGTVTGLTGTVVLQNNGGDNLSVSANGPFAFATRVAAGAAYNVSVLTQPTGQTCSASANAGTASADVSTVVVTCSANPARTIGGAVTGATGTVVLQNNSGDDLTIGANAPFTFATPVADGAGYNVTVLTPPAGQSCAVTNGTGIANANVTNVAVTCSAITYRIQAAVSGLAAGKSVTLQNNGMDNYSVSSNQTITFLTRYPDGAAYNVTVLTQPVAQTCTVNSGAGTVAGADVTVPVICSANSYTVGGAAPSGGVSGLLDLSGTFKLKNSATGELLSITATGDFAFVTKIAEGANTQVTVDTQPANQYCTVANGNINNILANVTNVTVNCVNTYAIGGMISSTSTAGGGPTLQNNGGDALAINAITTTPAAFAFATRIPDGQTYNVTQLVRASGPIQECSVTGGGNGTGGGTVAGADVTSVTVSCTPISAVPRFALVANSTAGAGTAFDTVSSYTIGGGTGALTLANTAATENDPIAVAVEPGGKYAYVVNRGSSTISGYIIDNVVGSPTYGQLAVNDMNAGTPTTITTVNTPTSITIHPSGKFVYVVSEGAGATLPAISAYAINATTGVLSVVDLNPSPASTTLTLAAGTVPYTIVVDPSGRFAYVPNYAGGSVSAYTVNQTTGALTFAGTVAAGTGPASVAVDPAGNCALVANNGVNSTTVSAYTIDQATGALTAAAGSPFTAGTEPRSVAIDPVAGAYAFVANAGSNNVSGFSLNLATCALTSIDTDAVAGGNEPSIAAGMTPLSINIDPSAAYVYVANWGGDTVSTYSIGAGGALTPVGAAIATGAGPASVTTVALP